MNGWIDRDTALSRLGVKAQTLYAYASRGRIRVQSDPADSRRSLYNADDIAEVSVRKARGRRSAAIAASSMNWGEPAIPTSLSTIHHGKLYYRGQDAIELARSSMVEEAAALLWDVRRPPDFSGHTIEASEDAFSVLATYASQGQPILGRSSEHLAQDAAMIIGGLASVCGAISGFDPIHERLARGWNCDAQSSHRLRQALVAMADHDLNASTFAARVAASTGASLPACLLAGLCTLSGPRHGGAGEALRFLAEDSRRQGAEKAVLQWLERDRMLPGFGHNLYPDGDPRAAMMLSDIEPTADLLALAASVFELTGLLPNCDYALAVMVEVLRLPKDAPFQIFLIGRAVGWCAHVIEQNRDGTLIRPRGKYVGVLPS
ncbi:citrate synthase [Sphingorhabdus sp.]|uniref:citrate synthase n=1 Tax=Sphingorhabdus sp. TaxID=1902408 RepID=UPI00359477AB